MITRDIKANNNIEQKNKRMKKNGPFKQASQLWKATETRCNEQIIDKTETDETQH